MKQQILTDAEIVQVAKAAMRGNEHRGLAEDDLVLIIKWAEFARLEHTILDRVLNHDDVTLSVRNGKVMIGLAAKRVENTLQ